MRGMYTPGECSYCPNPNPPVPKKCPRFWALECNHASEAVEQKQAMHGTNNPNLNIFCISQKKRTTLFKSVLEFDF